MVSSSISHNSLRTNYQLRLVDETDGSAQVFSLYGGERMSGDFDLASEGIVHEAHSYQAVLLSAEPLETLRVVIHVNGEWMLESVARSTGAPIVRDGSNCYCYQLACEGLNRCLFRMTYGFAVVEVDIALKDGRVLDLATRSIPCACDRDDQERVVAEMLAELTSGNGDKAIQWMLSPSVQGSDGLSFLEGSVLADASKSLRAYLKLCEGAIACYESNMGYFRAHAHSRILRRDEVIPIQRARRLGRRELQWLARSPEALYETKALTAISIKDKHYAVNEIQTERMFRSLNNEENRSLVAFAIEIATSLGTIDERSRSQIDWLQGIADQLGHFDPGAGLLPALVVVNACLERELPLIERVSILRTRARWIQNCLTQIMVDVPTGSFKMPRRSKVFQEVKPYSDIYAQMQMWNDFGDFELLRDGLALQTWRMDKLYEYFVLYRFLEALHRFGFSPDMSSSEPVKQVRYSVKSRVYKNENQVANIYDLGRGKESVKLFYEPVIYGDNREEHGVYFHRTTRKQPFSECVGDSYWTPDFLIIYSDGCTEKRFIFDAKFRTVGKVRGDGSDNDAKSCYEACALKYKSSILDAEGKGIDSLWLLCGRAAESELLIYQNSSWAQSRPGLLPDGIATVAPGADMLDNVLKKLGIGVESVIEESASEQQLPIAQEGRVGEYESEHLLDAGLQDGASSSQDYSASSSGDSNLEGAHAVKSEERETVNQLRAQKLKESDADFLKPRVQSPLVSNANEQIHQNLASTNHPENALFINEVGNTAGVSEAQGESINEMKVEKAQLPNRHKAAKAEGELLEKIRRICDLTVDKSALFSASSAQENFGFNHPLLRESLPRGSEAKLYTKERREIEGGNFYVYSSWRPTHISRLDRCLRQNDALMSGNC